jgi:hypothetical protein
MPDDSIFFSAIKNLICLKLNAGDEETLPLILPSVIKALVLVGCHT